MTKIKRRTYTAYESALEYFTPETTLLRVATVQNNLGNALAVLSRTSQQMANLRRAIAAYESALEYRTPETAPLDYAQTQNNLGNVYRYLSEAEERRDNLRRAIAAYESALEYRTPETAPLDYAETQSNLGIAYRYLSQEEEREDNLRRAIAAYESALEYRTPETAPRAYAETQSNLGNVYTYLSEAEEREDNLRRAIAAYNRSIEFRPDYAWVLTQRGQVLRNLNRYDEALTDFTTAIDINRPPMAFVYKASILSKQREFEKAEANYNEALEITDYAPYVLRNRAGFYLDWGYCDKAQADLLKSEESEPNAPYLHYHRARLLVLSGEPEAALKFIEQALQHDDPHLGLHIVCTLAYLVLADHDASRESVETFLSVNDNISEIEEAIETVEFFISQRSDLTGAEMIVNRLQQSLQR